MKRRKDSLATEKMEEVLLATISTKHVMWVDKKLTFAGNITQYIWP